MKVRAKVDRLYLKKGQEYEVVKKDNDCFYIQWNGILACVGLDEVEEVDNKAYDLKSRYSLQKPTVAEIMRCLSCLKPTAKLHICGEDMTFFHVSRDGSVVNLDCSPLDEEYDMSELDTAKEVGYDERIGSCADIGSLYKVLMGIF